MLTSVPYCSRSNVSASRNSAGVSSFCSRESARWYSVHGCTIGRQRASEAACAALELSVLVEDHLRTFAERVARHSLRDTDSGLCVLLQEPLFAAFEAGDLLFLDDFLGAQICVEHFELTRL